MNPHCGCTCARMRACRAVHLSDSNPVFFSFIYLFFSRSLELNLTRWRSPCKTLKCHMVSLTNGRLTRPPVMEETSTGTKWKSWGFTDMGGRRHPFVIIWAAAAAAATAVVRPARLKWFSQCFWSCRRTAEEFCSLQANVSGTDATSAKISVIFLPPELDLAWLSQRSKVGINQSPMAVIWPVCRQRSPEDSKNNLLALLSVCFY